MKTLWPYDRRVRIVDFPARVGLAWLRMDYARALDSARRLASEEQSIGFVTPVMSVCLAARAESLGSLVEPDFGDCTAYARNIGLLAAIRKEEAGARQGELLGETYSPLTRLQIEAEVEACNAIVNGVLHRKLASHDPRLVRGICKLVGELHDNVASHSRGVGFSAAQVYATRLEFAVADTGIGFLAKVRRKAGLAAGEHSQAIAWCFEKGNTSTDPVEDSWKQRWAPGVADEGSDYGKDGNSHQGLGLWILEKLILEAEGSLWVASGNCQKFLTKNGWTTLAPPCIEWSGVVLGIEIPLNPSTKANVKDYTSEDERIRKEMGLL